MTLRSFAAASLAATTAAGALVVMTAPAASAFEPPPLNCGMTRPEIGPLSSQIHKLEAGFRPLKLDGVVNTLNCSVVIELERALGVGVPAPF